MERRSTYKTLGTLAVVALLLIGGAAQANTLDGANVVLQRDVTRKTLLLDGGVVLHVNDKTLITNEFGQKITLADVPSATKDPGRDVYSVQGNETIEWEALLRGKKTLATQIRVLGFPLD